MNIALIVSFLLGLANSYRQDKEFYTQWKFIWIDFAIFTVCYQFGSVPVYWLGYGIGMLIFGIISELARPSSVTPNDSNPHISERRQSELAAFQQLEDTPERDIWQELIHANDPDYPCGETDS